MEDVRMNEVKHEAVHTESESKVSIAALIYK